MTTLNTRQLIELAGTIKVLTRHCDAHYGIKVRNVQKASWELLDDHYANLTIVDQDIELDAVHYGEVCIITDVRPQGFKVLMQFLMLDPARIELLDRCH